MTTTWLMKKASIALYHERLNGISAYIFGSAGVVAVPRAAVKTLNSRRTRSVADPATKPI